MFRKHSASSNRTLLIALSLFLLVLVGVALGTSRLANTTSEEGVLATQQAIQRAAVLCYASEGFYPPTLAYIEENYGVQIDYDTYVVAYDIFASNIMPSVRVVARG